MESKEYYSSRPGELVVLWNLFPVFLLPFLAPAKNKILLPQFRESRCRRSFESSPEALKITKFKIFIHCQLEALSLLFSNIILLNKIPVNCWHEQNFSAWLFPPNLPTNQHRRRRSARACCCPTAWPSERPACQTCGCPWPAVRGGSSSWLCRSASPCSAPQPGKRFLLSCRSSQFRDVWCCTPLIRDDVTRDRAHRRRTYRLLEWYCRLWNYIY